MPSPTVSKLFRKRGREPIDSRKYSSPPRNREADSGPQDGPTHRTESPYHRPHFCPGAVGLGTGDLPDQKSVRKSGHESNPSSPQGAPGGGPASSVNRGDGHHGDPAHAAVPPLQSDHRIAGGSHDSFDPGTRHPGQADQPTEPEGSDGGDAGGAGGVGLLSRGLDGGEHQKSAEKRPTKQG